MIPFQIFISILARTVLDDIFISSIFRYRVARLDVLHRPTAGKINPWWIKNLTPQESMQLIDVIRSNGGCACYWTLISSNESNFIAEQVLVSAPWKALINVLDVINRPSAQLCLLQVLENPISVWTAHIVFEFLSIPWLQGVKRHKKK